MLEKWILPAHTNPIALRLLIGRSLRAFVDGYVAVLLPVYLLALGLGTWEVGLIASATLLGSALLTMAVGVWGYRFSQTRLLRNAAALMWVTGLLFAAQSDFWPLLVIAFIGTLNPSAGDVSVFLPLEHARLAACATGDARTSLYARYSLMGAVCASFGALAAALPQWFTQILNVELLSALRIMFILYGVIGGTIWWLYRKIPAPDMRSAMAPAPLGPSRAIVFKLAALFSLDAFAGGLLVNALLALWLFQRFELSIAMAGVFFFWAGLLTALSQLLAPRVAKRIGLLNTMVYTHIPANLCLIVAAFMPSLAWALAFLLMRSALSQMDVPTRTAFVMAVVTPAERAAAASFTAVPRSLAAAASPTLGGALLATGWLAAPLVACGVLKIIYDVTILVAFRRAKLHAHD
ncbi:MAG: MFS transporter [Gammaproteobacteria bacterium]|nr:MFS transporter [Gammaproteobacteria bacterium]